MLSIIDDIKENDLLIVTKSFYYTDVDDNFKKVSYNHKKVKKESVLLVLENNFGATYKDRYVICLLGNKKIYFNNRGLNAAISGGTHDFFNIINS